jgi:hypothetical protein
MTAVEKIREEIARINAVLARRGILYEDEAASHAAMITVLRWLDEDRDEDKKIERIAAAAEQFAPRDDAHTKYKARRL